MQKCNECGTIGNDRIDGRGKARCTACWSLNVAPYVAPLEIVASEQIVEPAAPVTKPRAKKGKAK